VVIREDRSIVENLAVPPIDIGEKVKSVWSFLIYGSIELRTQGSISMCIYSLSTAVDSFSPSRVVISPIRIGGDSEGGNTSAKSLNVIDVWESDGNSSRTLIICKN
tara:strand:- start:1013 stop:1330 length:318 start_codon:yes stop_codon:yes gene_type:complete